MDSEKLERLVKNGGTIRATLKHKTPKGFRLKVIEEGLEDLRAFMPAKMGRKKGVCLPDLVDTFQVKIISWIQRPAGNREGPVNEVLVSGIDHLSTLLFSRERAALNALSEGQRIRGKVVNTKDFGVFISLGDISGLLHRSNIPAEKALTPGETIEVEVKSIDRKKHRVALILPKKEEISPISAHNLEVIGAAHLKSMLGDMTEEEKARALPHLKKRADWSVRKLLRGKYAWGKEIM